MSVDLRDPDLFVYRFEAGGVDSFWLTRQLVERWLLERGARDDRVPELLVAINELFTNAVGHGAGRAPVMLRLRVSGTDLTGEIEDAGDAVGLPDDGGTPGFPGGGAGGDLRLAAAVVDEVTLRVAGGRTRVRFVAGGVIVPPASA